MLARSHVVVALAGWGALWWRPLDAATSDDLLAALHGLATVPPLVAPVVSAVTMPDTDLSGRVAVTAALVALGALLPDLDHPHAWLARWRLARGGLLGLIRPFALPSHLLHEQFGHRGPLHALIAPVLLLLGAQALDARLPALADLLWPLLWGYTLHLAADLLTRRGLPLFAPLWRARFYLPWPLAVRTGTWGEALYVTLIVIGAATYALCPSLATGAP